MTCACSAVGKVATERMTDANKCRMSSYAEDAGCGTSLQSSLSSELTLDFRQMTTSAVIRRASGDAPRWTETLFVPPM